jgi:hypothetical protein
MAKVEVARWVSNEDTREHWARLPGSASLLPHKESPEGRDAVAVIDESAFGIFTWLPPMDGRQGSVVRTAMGGGLVGAFALSCAGIAASLRKPSSPDGENMRR